MQKEYERVRRTYKKGDLIFEDECGKVYHKGFSDDEEEEAQEQSIDDIIDNYRAGMSRKERVRRLLCNKYNKFFLEHIIYCQRIDGVVGPIVGITNKWCWSGIYWIAGSKNL